jgi:hypothetical protein
MDERLLAEARQAKDRLAEAEHDAEVARGKFRFAVRRMAVRSSRPGDIAAALGLSDSELQEIIDEGREHAPANVLTCSFCGGAQYERGKIVVGSDVYICDLCVELASGVTSSGTAAGAEPGTMRAVPAKDGQTRCSFCGKKRSQVAAMAAATAESGGGGAGPAVVCTECLTLCNEIFSEQLA